MLLLRLLGVLAAAGIGVSLVLWLLTGKARYRYWAWIMLRAALIVLAVFLVVLALERVLVPLV